VRAHRPPSETELRRGERVSWGGKSAPAPVKPKLRIISGKKVVKGTLHFVCKVGLPFGSGELEIDGVMVFSSHGKSWANLPSKPVLDQNGVHMTAENGKKMYAPFLEWSPKELRGRFSAAVVDLVKELYPGALNDDGGAG
jgi:hypothetical protein